MKFNGPPEDLFNLWNSYPDLLPPVEHGATREAMVERVERQPPCCHCGIPSEYVMMAVHNRGGRRWVDLCSECRDWVREGMERQQLRRMWSEEQGGE